MTPNRYLSHWLWLALALSMASARLAAQSPPGLLSYQGRLVVNNVNLDGPGYFKFALVQSTNGPTLWSNDGAAEPNAPIQLSVAKGLYSVLLGDTNLPGMNQEIPASVFANSDVRLRVWFGTSPAGPFDLLAPDHRISSVGYAMMAASVAPGAIQSDQLPSDPEFEGVASADGFAGGEAFFGRLNISQNEDGIRFGGARFLHAWGANNTFAGTESGNFFMTGSNNTGVGYAALQTNLEGEGNTALGSRAMDAHVYGDRNVAIGAGALGTLSSQNPLIPADNNIALGYEAGIALTLGSNNIYIGNSGVQTETNVIRIGTPGTQLATFLSGNVFADAFVGAMSLPATTDPSKGITLNKVPFLHAYGTGNTFAGSGSGNFTMNGGFNVGIGHSALNWNTDGQWNTALGYLALGLNTTGTNNTASGALALYQNENGQYNTAHGVNAMRNNISGSYNTGLGGQSLLSHNTGLRNTAIGYDSFRSLTNGDDNVALGYRAGAALTSGSGNTYLGNEGNAFENNTLRLGQTQTSAFIAGIFGSTATGGLPVYINSEGQLGTLSSSRRFKEEIYDMDAASEVIHALRPVTFRYKLELDPKAIPQFGLIAEEVNDLAPGLVVSDAKGEIQSVRYEAVNAMLLNEFQKEHRQVQQHEETISQLQQQIGDINARLSQLTSLVDKLEAQLERRAAAEGGLSASQNSASR